MIICRVYPEDVRVSRPVGYVCRFWSEEVPGTALGFKGSHERPQPHGLGHSAIISPPKDYNRWGTLVRGLTQHLVDRYGRDQVDDLGVGEWPAVEAKWDEIADASKLHTTETTVTAHGGLDIGLMINMPSAVLVDLLPS